MINKQINILLRRVEHLVSSTGWGLQAPMPGVDLGGQGDQTKGCSPVVTGGQAASWARDGVAEGGVGV